jgi:hypothetical protein
MPRRKSRRALGRGRRSGKERKMVLSDGNLVPSPQRTPTSKSWVIPINGFTALTTSGAGTISGFLPCDPSATLSAPFSSGVMFPEWTSLATLFGQVRLVQMELRLTPCGVDETKGDVTNPLAYSPVQATASAPSSYQAVMDNAGSSLWNCLTDTSGKTRYTSIRGRGNIFASTSSPAPSTSIYAGCPGGFGFYLTPTPVSTQICLIAIKAVYEFRDRV